MNVALAARPWSTHTRFALLLRGNVIEGVCWPDLHLLRLVSAYLAILPKRKPRSPVLAGCVPAACEIVWIPVEWSFSTVLLTPNAWALKLPNLGVLGQYWSIIQGSIRKKVDPRWNVHCDGWYYSCAPKELNAPEIVRPFDRQNVVAVPKSERQQREGG